jgi:hypothetical protein
MLTTPEDGMVGTMSFSSLTDAVAIAMKQWSAKNLAFIVETFLEMATLLLKHSEYFASISMLLLTKSFLPHLKKEPPGSVRTVRSTQNIEAVRQSFI